jgi:primase-polymerase (primpol)-like protein
MTKLRIKPVNHGLTPRDKNRYCGPSVISAITGMTTGEAAAQLRAVSGKRAIKGTHTSWIRAVLRRNNIEMLSCRDVWNIKLNRTDGITLAGWLKHTVKDRNADRVFLIVAGWHWQLVQGRRYVCGQTKQIVSIRDKRVKRRARVAEIYELSSR